VTVTLASGNEHKIFLKDFGSHQQMKEGMKRRRERELFVYKDLLEGAGLDTARYYGCIWNELESRFWLLLEFVQGERASDNFSEYLGAAAGWLGRMHGHFSQHSARLKGAAFLVHHDPEFFWSKAEHAARAVSQIAPPMGGRLASLLSRYDQLVEVITSQPQTLIHTTYRLDEILVDRSSKRLRLCPVDWELAAYGSPLYDLAFFTDGFEPPSLNEVLGAYRQEALSYKLYIPDGEEMRHAMNCFRFYRVINWLSQALDREYPESKVLELLALAEKRGSVVFQAHG
jgi:aminoglycoside phosphotransferase (APT) family kinase protein